MRKKMLLALTGLFVLMMTSCNRSGKTGLLVPENATIVLHINMASLTSKLTWAEIQQTNWYKESGQGKADSLQKKLMENPESSGIDLKGDHVLFTAGSGNLQYIAFVGALKDPAAYEKMVVASTEQKLTIERKGDLSFTTNDQTFMVWDKKHFVFVSNSPSNNLMAFDPRGEGRNKQISQDSLKLIGLNILDLDGDELLDGDERFADMIKEEGDLHFWMNNEHMYTSMSNGMLSMLKVNALLENNVMAATLNFDNGKIIAKAKQYYGDEMKALLKKYPAKDIDDAVIGRLPARDVIAAGVFNYPPEGIRELMKLTGTDGLVNAFLAENNYSVDEFVKANKGDVAFAVTDYLITSDSATWEDGDGVKHTYPRTKQTVKFVAGVSVNDRASFDKLVNTLASNVMRGDSIPGVNYKLQNDWFAAGNDDAHLAAFLNGGNKPAYGDKLKGHSGAFYMDLQRMINVGGSGMRADQSEEGKKALAASLAMWQDIVATTDFKDGVSTATFEVNLVDKSTNSLKQLNKYVDVLAGLRPKNEEVRIDTIDSTAVPVPDTTLAN